MTDGMDAASALLGLEGLVVAGVERIPLGVRLVHLVTAVRRPGMPVVRGVLLVGEGQCGDSAPGHPLRAGAGAAGVAQARVALPHAGLSAGIVHRAGSGGAGAGPVDGPSGGRAVRGCRGAGPVCGGGGRALCGGLVDGAPGVHGVGAARAGRAASRGAGAGYRRDSPGQASLAARGFGPVCEGGRPLAHQLRGLRGQRRSARPGLPIVLSVPAQRKWRPPCPVVRCGSTSATPTRRHREACPMATGVSSSKRPREAAPASGATNGTSAAPCPGTSSAGCSPVMWSCAGRSTPRRPSDWRVSTAWWVGRVPVASSSSPTRCSPVP